MVEAEFFGEILGKPITKDFLELDIHGRKVREVFPKISSRVRKKGHVIIYKKPAKPTDDTPWDYAQYSSLALNNEPLLRNPFPGECKFPEECTSYEIQSRIYKVIVDGPWGVFFGDELREVIPEALSWQGSPVYRSTNVYFGEELSKKEALKRLQLLKKSKKRDEFKGLENALLWSTCSWAKPDCILHSIDGKYKALRKDDRVIKKPRIS